MYSFEGVNGLSSRQASPWPPNFTSACFAGFKITDKGCCDVPTGEIPCAPLTYPCLNRDEHVYWNGAHYTEARATIFGKRAYKRQFPVDAYPYDISELAKVPNDEANGCSTYGSKIL